MMSPHFEQGGLLMRSSFIFVFFFGFAGLLQSFQIQNFVEHFGYVGILGCLPF